MPQIITNIDKKVRANTVKRFRERSIVLPTFKQLMNPGLIPTDVKQKLAKIGMNEVNPLNLFRISWKNDVKTGLFGKVNYVEIPSFITGVKARIFGLVGKHFPTGAHKVGSAYGCLVPRIVSGQFDPTVHKAVWPSTGNYCRGGAFDCALMACIAVAVLPAGMSKERFDWLKQIGSEIVATPGTESNVKEIYDACREMRKNPVNLILNQFDDMGNPMFHYNVTGSAMREVFEGDIASKNKKARVAAYISATGSAGTIAAGDYLKKYYPEVKVVVGEARQCPTIFMNGFGEHRIEGIGDKHIPWVHNVRSTDAVSAIDDEDCYRIMRLFNEKVGLEFLTSVGLKPKDIQILSLLGVSGISNLLSSIRTAKYFEMDDNDVIFTNFTDSMELYGSRLTELESEKGEYTTIQAAQDFAACLQHQDFAYYRELNYYQRKAVHNLKYFTWVEQQGKTSEELNAQWHPEYWRAVFEEQIENIDQMIVEFNDEIKKG